MAMTQWSTIIRQCLLRRMSATEFLNLIRRQKNVNGKIVCKVLLDCRHTYCARGDPLPILYLETLTLSGTVTVADVLLVLISGWNLALRTEKRVQSSHPDLSGLQDLTLSLMSSKLVIDEKETKKCLLLSSRWLTAIAHSMTQDSNHESTSNGNNILETVGYFLATLSATNAGIQLLSEPKTMDSKLDPMENDRGHTIKAVSQATDLAVSLFPMISVQLMERLGAVQKHIAMFGERVRSDSMEASEVQALQFQAGIAETQMAASRAGTAAYLEAMLVRGRTTDDTTFINFLAGRHNNEYASMFLDVLFSSFQLLNSFTTQNAKLYHQQCKIFVLNKLPSILATISTSSFGSFSSQDALSTAWPQIAAELSTEDNTTSGPPFLHACSLHHLIELEIAQKLMGVDDPGVSAKVLHSKDDFITQMNSPHTGAAKLIDELVSTAGNAAAIGQAMVEVMQTYCNGKETHHLKDVANAMLRKPSAINTLAMFIRPSNWLTPLCSLLDDWHWDEIHGESQPVYDEFGSVFLLILASKRRLGLSRSEIGIRSRDGFVARYLDQEGAEQNLDELSDESQKHLGDWINALYIAEGLSDELTTTCSPQEFYLLVPTLLMHSFSAYQKGQLGRETLKAGLEYLLEPFLLPSLVSALTWVRRTLQRDQAATIMLQIFTKSPSGTEAREIHQTILAMVSGSLKAQMKQLAPSPAITTSLTILDKCEPFSFDVSVIAPNLFNRLQQNISNKISSLSNTEQDAAFTSFLLRGATQAHGPILALNCLIDVLLQFSGSNDFLIALDVIATTLCTADSPIRDALRLRYSRLGNLLKKNDTLTAEAIVHLHRRVEAYASVLVVPDMGIDQFASLQLSNIDPTGTELDDATNNVPGEDLTSQPQMDDIDQVLDEAAAMGNIEQSDTGMSMDDLYGLQSDSMGLGNLDDLDLDMF